MKEKLLERLVELNDWLLDKKGQNWSECADELRGYKLAVKDEIKFLKEILGLKD